MNDDVVMSKSDQAACSPSFRSMVKRIASDYIPESDSQAPLALAEMREALQELLANTALRRVEPVASNGLVGGFDLCCGQPPNVTEWRPGSYGAQCMVCGVIVGDERQLDKEELREAWNRAIQLRAAVAAERERCARVCDDEARIRTEAGNTHPEDSDSRGRCFAAARAAINCAKGVRGGEIVWPNAEAHGRRSRTVQPLVGHSESEKGARL
jgi:hypothetical protein